MSAENDATETPETTEDSDGLDIDADGGFLDENAAIEAMVAAVADSSESEAQGDGKPPEAAKAPADKPADAEAKDDGAAEETDDKPAAAEVPKPPPVVDLDEQTQALARMRAEHRAEMKAFEQQMATRMRELKDRASRAPDPEKARQDPLGEFARFLGTDPYTALQTLNQQAASGSVKKPDPQAQRDAELAGLRKEIEEMKASRQRSADEAERGELRVGIDALIAQGNYPAIKGVGAEAARDLVFAEILRQYEADPDGELPRAADLLEKLEGQYREDLKRVYTSEEVRKVIGLTEALQKPTKTEDPGAGGQQSKDGTPTTLTNEDTQEVSTAAEVDSWESFEDDDALIQKAVEAAQQS